MKVKQTGNHKKDFKKRRGYEFEGYYFDTTGSYLLWRKKFWRKKKSKEEYKKQLQQMEKDLKEVRAMQRRIYG